MTTNLYCRHFTQGNDIWFSVADLCAGLEIENPDFAVNGIPALGDYGLPANAKRTYQHPDAPDCLLWLNPFGASLLSNGHPRSREAALFAEGIVWKLIPETIAAAGLEQHFQATGYFTRMAAGATPSAA